MHATAPQYSDGLSSRAVRATKDVGLRPRGERVASFSWHIDPISLAKPSHQDPEVGRHVGGQAQPSITPATPSLPEAAVRVTECHYCMSAETLPVVACKAAAIREL